MTPESSTQCLASPLFPSPSPHLSLPLPLCLSLFLCLCLSVSLYSLCLCLSVSLSLLSRSSQNQRSQEDNSNSPLKLKNIFVPELNGSDFVSASETKVFDVSPPKCFQDKDGETLPSWMSQITMMKPLGAEQPRSS